MFPNICQCCFTENILLLPLRTESSHDDGKTLWDYLNIILPSFVKENITTQFICLRCSKALQVSYHFISMIRETVKVRKISSNNNKGSDSIAKVNIQQNGFADNVLDFENKFKFHINKESINNEAEIIQISDIGSTTKTHSKSSKISCYMCNKHFDNKQLLSDHNQKVHKELIPYKCKLCNFYSCYTASLFQHYKKKHELINVELSLYQTKESFEDVKENPKFEILYKCLECSFESLNESEMDDHRHDINEKNDSLVTKLFKCPSCHRAFNDLKSVKIHYTMYHNREFKRSKITGNKKHACEKCGALFDLKSGLLLHQLRCDLKTAVKCNFCNLKFSTVLKYEKHLQTKHAVAIKHECEICGKVFRCSEYLAVHRKRHNERYYQCDLCSKNYINNAELRIHKQRNHNKLIAQVIKEKKSKTIGSSCHKCAYCNFETYSRYYLKLHQYSHNGGKPYKCRLCPKEFVHRQHLRAHCENLHLISVTNEELANMFKEYYGYVSRFDAFSKQNNNLEISEVSNLELEKELNEFGLTLQDIMNDLFVSEIESK